MARLALLLAAVMATPGNPGLQDGVMVPKSGWKDNVAVIEQGGVQQITSFAADQFVSYMQSALPPDDRGQWYITVFVTDMAGDSRLLLRDLENAPALRVLSEWGTLQVIDYSTEANRQRWSKLKIRYTPTILVYPRPGHPRLEYKYAVAQEGYGGDADKLARNIFNAIRKIYKAQGVADCPGPYCPSPRFPYEPNQPHDPYRPNQPTPNDWPQPAPLPNGFDDSGGGFHVNLSLDRLFSGIVGAVKWIVILVLLLWIAPPLLKFVIRRFKESASEIIATARSPVAEPKPDGGGEAANPAAKDS